MKCGHILSLIFFVLITVSRDKLALGFLDFGASVGAGLGAVAGIYAGYEYVKCKYKECCSQEWITLNIKGVSEDFSQNLYGQHLAEDIVVRALRAHFRSKPVKPLVMSFHGWTGGGKNFVSALIAKNIYKEGLKSQFVHLFIGERHFKHKDLIDQYKDNLQEWIHGNVSKCELSMFIFDEVDKIPVGVLDAVKPFLDYYEGVDGVDYRNAIFIFLSNTGGRQITEKVLQHLNAGSNREDLTYHDLEELVLKGAFNEPGGLSRTSMIEKSLIDYYVPFLPLERRHVQQCIIDELKREGHQPDQLDSVVKKILNEIPYYPDNPKLFSKVGCKTVNQKVRYYQDELEDIGRQDDENTDL